MKCLLSWLIVISFCMVLFNVSFNFKDYLENLNHVFGLQPKFPVWSIDWNSFSITNWEPLGDFFKCIYYTIKYFFDFVLWCFDIVLHAFGLHINVDIKDALTGANGGGGHGGTAG